MNPRADRCLFGSLPDGAGVEAITLRNSEGMSVRLLTWGATIQALEVPDRDGRSSDVVLGFADLAGYLAHDAYFGATVGRYANRIADGQFRLVDTTWRLARNEGRNTLHGGITGFDRRLWSIAEVRTSEEPEIALTYISPDGEEGFPGTLSVEAVFRLSKGNELAIEYRATTDAPTIVNLTGHSYFNLAGEGSQRDILDHVLTIPAESFLPIDDTLIPTGEFRQVAGTPFDFREGQKIGARIREGADQQLLRAHGYDHNWVLAPQEEGALRLHARLEDGSSGRVLEVLSDQPGLQFYSGNFLNGTFIGKSGRTYRQSDGLCLEPQLFPDTPNRPKFGSAALAPGQTYRHRIVYRFSTR